MNPIRFQSCNLGLPDKLNVHIVAHTHDDVGWLKTVDQYYYGCELRFDLVKFYKLIFLAHPEITKKNVQYILDSVIDALVQNPDRRYIYVEMAFFWRWWNQQSEDIRNVVKQLVNESLYSLNILMSPRIDMQVVWSLFRVVGV